METNVFERSVWIYVGLNVEREITTVAQAYAFLHDWPVQQRGVAHSLATKACKAALLGEIEAETARDAFSAFARRAGILAPELDVVIAAHALSRSGNRPGA